jgi:DNA-binding Xre family transcriptional regulator
MKSHSYQDVLQKELADAEFRAAYEELEEEFTVAKEIIRLRKARGWTQRDLAEHAQTSQPAVARLGSGNYRNVSLSFLRKIGRALGAVPVVHMHVVNEDSGQHA